MVWILTRMMIQQGRNLEVCPASSLSTMSTSMTSSRSQTSSSSISSSPRVLLFKSSTGTLRTVVSQRVIGMQTVPIKPDKSQKIKRGVWFQSAAWLSKIYLTQRRQVRCYGWRHLHLYLLSRPCRWSVPLLQGWQDRWERRRRRPRCQPGRKPPQSFADLSDFPDSKAKESPRMNAWYLSVLMFSP